MRNSNIPSGPGQLKDRAADAATEQEGLEELDGDRAGGNASSGGGSGRGARQAERSAHTKSENDTAASGTSGERRG